MLRKAIYVVFLFISCCTYAQQPDFKLYLVGDAGEDEVTGETLDSVKCKLLNNPNSAILFMGDNCYKNTFFGLFQGYKGFDSSKITQRKMMSQLNILNGYKGSAYFVPGNHDWWNIPDFNKGKKKIRMEESFIETNLRKNKTIANPNETFLPKDGKPGPATVELNNKKIRVVFIDTYWLILLGFKENPKENFAIAKSFYHNLDSTLTLATEQHQTIVVVAHHPVYYSNTPIDQGLSVKKKLKHPHPLSRLKQSNITFPSYDTMAVKINAILQKYPGIYYASGHLHALQFHKVKGVNYIISGSGSKTHKVSEKDAKQEYCSNNDCELWNEKGFAEMYFIDNYSPGVIIYHNNGRENTVIQLPLPAKNQ